MEVWKEEVPKTEILDPLAACAIPSPPLARLTGQRSQAYRRYAARSTVAHCCGHMCLPDVLRRDYARNDGKGIRKAQPDRK